METKTRISLNICCLLSTITVSSLIGVFSFIWRWFRTCRGFELCSDWLVLVSLIWGWSGQFFFVDFYDFVICRTRNDFWISWDYHILWACLRIGRRQINRSFLITLKWYFIGVKPVETPMPQPYTYIGSWPNKSSEQFNKFIARCRCAHTSCTLYPKINLLKTPLIRIP